MSVKADVRAEKPSEAGDLLRAAQRRIQEAAANKRASTDPFGGDDPASDPRGKTKDGKELLEKVAEVKAAQAVQVQPENKKPAENIFESDHEEKVEIELPATPAPISDANGTKPKRRRKKLAMTSPTAESGPVKAPPGGFVDRVDEDEEPRQRHSWTQRLPSMPKQVPGLVMVVTLCMLMSLSVISLAKAPDVPLPSRCEIIDMAHGDSRPVPAELLATWLRDCPLQEEFRRGNPEDLAAIQQWLGAQAVVSNLHNVRVMWDTNAPANQVGPLPAKRMLRVELSLRQPVLAVILHAGKNAWVDADGVLLPGYFAGPAKVPTVIGLERDTGGQALHEVLEAWPELSTSLPAGTIAMIDLDDDLGRPGARGIVMHAASGTTIRWGNPRETDYGLTPTDKAIELARTVKCQGNLEHVAFIDVRFTKPVAVLAQR